MTYTLIAHQELASSAASITFMNTGNIPATFTDLLLVLSGRGSVAQVFAGTRLQFNGASSNYSFRALQGSGSGTVSFSSDGIGSSVRIGLSPGASATASTFGSTSVYIPNYRVAAAKSFSSDSVTENNGTTAYQEIIAGLWNDTAAITSITLITDAGQNWVSGTSATLYGITAGSSGGVVVS